MRIQAQVRRVIDIVLLLNDSRYGWSVNELASRYGVHKRTIIRDLETLSQMVLAVKKDGKWFGVPKRVVSETVNKEMGK